MSTAAKGVVAVPAYELEADRFVTELNVNCRLVLLEAGRPAAGDGGPEAVEDVAGRC